MRKFQGAELRILLLAIKDNKEDNGSLSLFAGFQSKNEIILQKSFLRWNFLDESVDFGIICQPKQRFFPFYCKKKGGTD